MAAATGRGTARAGRAAVTPGGRGAGPVRRRCGAVPGERADREGSKSGPGERYNGGPGSPRSAAAGVEGRGGVHRPPAPPLPAGATGHHRTASRLAGSGRAPMMTESPIRRRVSRPLRIGSVAVGGDAPISVQSMTNTDTCDVAATVDQIRRLEQAGADIVRVSVPSMDAAEAFRAIRSQVAVPLVADIHFDHRIALKVAEYGVDCLRINPGNIGREDRVRAVVSAARDRGIPIRIGVNAGSLERDLQRKYGEPTADALVESALRHIEHFDRLDFADFKLSVKASDVFMAVAAYRKIAGLIEQPLHLGITEAGGLRSGTVKSAVGLGLLLMEGIGDTLRVSLADRKSTRLNSSHVASSYAVFCFKKKNTQLAPGERSQFSCARPFADLMTKATRHWNLGRPSPGDRSG